MSDEEEIILPAEHFESVVRIVAEGMGFRVSFLPLNKSAASDIPSKGFVLSLPEFRRELVLHGPQEAQRQVLEIIQRLASSIGEQERESLSLTKEIMLRYEQLAILFEMSEKLGMARDNQARITAILETAAGAISATCGCLQLTDGNYRFLSHQGQADCEDELCRITRQVMESNKPQIDEQHHLSLPLGVTEHQPIGAITMGPKVKGSYRSGDIKMLVTLSSYAALLLESGRLYEGLELLFFSTIRSMVEAIDAKDPRTRGHSERVRRYSVKMAQKMGLSSEDRKLLELAALLHDLGKIGLPDSILNNEKSRLTDEQWHLVKQHPEIGVSILSHVAQLKEILPAIGQHHERYDGRGYPMGVKGKEISLFARIIAVADAYDAMTTQRTYRPTFDNQMACRELKDNAGRQFDPQAVELFLQSFEEIDTP
jgi:putative nucleotidyltransferase with HDIG domain